MKKRSVISSLLIVGMLFLLMQPAIAKTKKKDFISLAYVALNFLQLENKEASEVKDILDQYNWRGISDVALIGGVFTAGKDGSLLVSWNKEKWPPVYECMDYKNDPINEQAKRDKLCSKEVIKAVVKYFKKKKI